MEPAALSNDDLIDQITTWAARVARGEATHLDLIAELDTREVWTQHGATSCAQWLSWKLGWCQSTARERVRVAQALRSLPLIHQAFGDGQLSYSQVRAVTRIATADQEDRWLEVARRCTGAQLDKMTRGAARARAADQPAEERLTPTASKHWDDNGDLVLTLRIPAHQALPVLAVLEQHQAAEQADRDTAVAELLQTVAAGAAEPAAVEAASAEAPALLDATGQPTGPASAEASAPSDTNGQPTGPATAEASAPSDTNGQPAGPASAEASAPSDTNGQPTGPATAEASALSDTNGQPAGPASAEAPDELAAALAKEQSRGLDPLECYPFVEPPYPVTSERLGLCLSPGEEHAVERWRTDLRRRRAIRDAWNDRREQLLIEASARRLTTGRASLADGLVRALTRPTDAPPVTLRLLIDPISGWARDQRDELLPPATLTGVLDTLPGPVSKGAAHLDLCRQDKGRTTRTVHPALRRLLGQLDGERCRFPGCAHTRYLHAHHVEFWRNGGTTDLANLVLLCTRHHRLLHHAGYELTVHPDRTLTVIAPDGILLEHHPLLPAASAEALPPADPHTLPPTWSGERLDLGYAVNVMLAHAA